MRTLYTHTSDSKDRAVRALRLSSRSAEADSCQLLVDSKPLNFAPSRIRRGQKAVVPLSFMSFGRRLWENGEAMYCL